MYVGKKVTRVDAYDKVTGRTKYTDDLCDRGAYVAQILHATIPNGRVVSMDVSAAEAIPGVVKVFTCFDLKEKHYFPTAGHPWSTDESHQDVADRLVLTERVRFYGDDIAAVVAEDEVAAAQALRAIKVEYEEYPFVLDVQEAMKDGAPQLHEDYPNNILKHTSIRKGNYEEAIKEPGLIKVEGWYDTPTVQHCHMENFICTAEMTGDRIKIVSSTQIPHIVRRVVGQALGIPWGKIQVIKPYIGGGFGNKQDVLYEPLCAWLCTQLGGPSGEDRHPPGGHLCLQPGAPRHPQPHHLLGAARRHLRRPQAGGLLRPGRLRLPRPQHRRQGHGLLPPALPLRQRGGRRLHRVHQQVGGGRHAGLRHPPGHVGGGVPHRGRVRQAGAGPHRVPPEEPDACGLSWTPSPRTSSTPTPSTSAWTRA